MMRMAGDPDLRSPGQSEDPFPIDCSSFRGDIDDSHFKEMNYRI